MARVVVSAIADADRQNILDYLVTHAGYATAERYNVALRVTFRRLANFPDSSAPRPALGPSIRISVVHPFVAIYDYSGGIVTILRILHGKRHITGDLLGTRSGI